METAWIVLYIVLAGFVLIVVPILAISAFVRARRLHKPGGTDSIVLKRLTRLEERLGQVERRLEAARPAAQTEIASETPRITPPSKPTQPTPPAPPLPVAPLGPQAAVAQEEHAGRLDLETVIAGRWLNRVGILALLFAVSFFIKYAFENNWVGPRGRVAVGLLIGSALLPWSQWLLRRGYRYFSEGIAGLGAAVLYLSLWSGWHYYSLFGQGQAFAGMIVVTTAMVVVAIGRDSQRIALLAQIGGFLTPVLVSTGKDQQVVLFTYLAVLVAGLLVLARARDWAALAPVSFFATQIYFWGWYERFYNSEKLLSTSLFAALFFLLFAALPVVRSRWEARLPTGETSVLLLNALAYLVVLRSTLWPDYRWTLTLLVLALAAAHLGVASGLPRPREGKRSLVGLLFAGLALTFATLAIPIRLEGKWITIAWAMEGAVLVWSGLRAKASGLRVAGLVLFAIVAVRLAVFPIPATRFFLNARFAVFGVAVACFAAALHFVRRQQVELDELEKNAYSFLGFAINVYALWALSLEAWDLFGRMQTLDFDRDLAQQLALSVVWTVYATGLIVTGVKRRAAGLRWQGLALFGLVVGKVFLFDLSFLERFYRIVSFLLLGLVLLVVSFLYQRKSAAERGERRTREQL